MKRVLTAALAVAAAAARPGAAGDVRATTGAGDRARSAGRTSRSPSAT